MKPFAIKLIATVCASTLIASQLSGCGSVPIDPNDASKPSVVIKVKDKDGQFQAVDSVQASHSADVVADMMCVVSDPNGVKAVSLHISGMLDGCTVQGTKWDGNYPLSPVQQDAAQTLSGANGKAPTSLPVLAKVMGPLTCQVPGQGTGVPIGRDVIVTCVGQNWSAAPSEASATKKLTINIK